MQLGLFKEQFSRLLCVDQQRPPTAHWPRAGNKLTKFHSRFQHGHTVFHIIQCIIIYIQSSTYSTLAKVARIGCARFRPETPRPYGSALSGIISHHVKYSTALREFPPSINWCRGCTLNRTKQAKVRRDGRAPYAAQGPATDV